MSSPDSIDTYKIALYFPKHFSYLVRQTFIFWPLSTIKIIMKTSQVVQNYDSNDRCCKTDDTSIMTRGQESQDINVMTCLDNRNKEKHNSMA